MITDFFPSSMIAAFMAVNTYLIDAFTLYAASAMAANTILRSVRPPDIVPEGKDSHGRELLMQNVLWPDSFPLVIGLPCLDMVTP